MVTELTALLGGNFDGVVLKTTGMACSDPLVSTRKATIPALSEAFRTFSDESVIIEWLHSVPRLITDNETSIQEECENCSWNWFWIAFPVQYLRVQYTTSPPALILLLKWKV